MATGLNHSKPFGAQTPEQIAKDYGGNKQKIAQAMQLGIVDPTVGTLAGMFIDRMAAGAQQSQAPQGTVASQVFNPETPPAQAPGGAGPGGLPPAPGAPPAPPADAGAQMPPQAPQEMPPQGPGMADGGMVAFDSGGLAGLPVPDDMFNSSVGDSDVQHYAGGAEVGQYGPWFEQQASEAIPGINVTSRQRSAAHNAQVGGVGNSFHLTNNARDFTPPKGMSMGSLFKKLGGLYGAGYDVINEGDHIHVEPGEHAPARRPAATRAAAAPATPAAPPAAGLAAAALPSEDMSAMREQMAMLSKSRTDDLAAAKRERRQAAWTALGQRGLAMLMPQGASMAEGGEVPSYAGLGSPVVQPPANPLMPAVKDPMDAFKPEYLQAMQKNLSGLMPQSNKYADLMMEDVERRRNPETMKKDRKDAANQALMNFGLALMASKNSNFLGAIGESGMPAVAGLKADLKDLKKDAHDALVEGAQAEGMKNTAARELASLTLQNANIAAQLQSGNLDRAQRVELEKLQRDNAMAIARLNENGANYRAQLQETGANARAVLAATAEFKKPSLDVGTQKLIFKDAGGNDIERNVNTMVDKRTGQVMHYSNEAGQYLTPEYTQALAGHPGAMSALQQLAQRNKLKIEVVNGVIKTRDANGTVGHIKTDWLASH